MEWHSLYDFTGQAEGCELRGDSLCGILRPLLSLREPAFRQRGIAALCENLLKNSFVNLCERPRQAIGHCMDQKGLVQPCTFLY